MDFYNRLNYSLGNEDWSVESQALKVNVGDYVICVTASGDRSLHLLMTDCAQVTSIDMNPIQSYLLELKMAAIALLDYEKYLAFLGCTSCDHRLDIFQGLKSHLSPEGRLYWNNHTKKLISGVVYQGMVERLTNIVAICFNFIKKKDIQTLLSFSDIQEQRLFVHRHWNSRWLKKTFKILLNPKLMKLILNDPGIISHVDPTIQPGEYIYERMIQYLNTNLARKSALIQLLFTGKVMPEAYFPYLTFEGHSKIAKNLNRLKFYTGNITETLKQSPENKIDCFSLSDIASYMPQPAFENLLTAMITAAKPNARFCLRKLMSEHYIPERFKSYLQQDSALEQKLEREESNFVYRFMVGEIYK
jgi:S-adenosylmethionine-diacylglycerol 3-amino-3-carboxypropyl transferase